MWTRYAAWIFVCLAVWSYQALAAEPMRVRHQWEIDPDLDIHWVLPSLNYAQKSGRIDGETALDRLRGAQYARYAAENKLPVQKGSFEILLKQIRSGESNMQVRQALVSAASSLATASEIDELWPLVSNDPTCRLPVEQALARLRHPAARAAWRERLNGYNYSFQNWLLACEGLGAVGEDSDVSLFEKLVLQDKLPTPLRVAASRSLGMLARSSQSGLAKKLLQSNVEQRFLIAAHVLANQPPLEAAPILEQIIAEGPAAAQGVAYALLSKVSRERGRMLAPKMVAHPDNTVRVTALKLLQTFDDIESLDLQVKCFADVHPKVRELVRNHLLAKSTASPEMRQRIDEVVTFHLNSETWQGIEQAVLLCTELGDRGRCETLLKMLDHPQAEVNVTAAWSLRVLSDSPELYAKMCDHVRLWTKKIENTETAGSVTNDDQHRVAHLMEALGDRRYEPVEELLRIYVPKNNYKMGNATRIGAVWAIGKYWKDGDNPALIKQLAERAADKSGMFPELDTVRFTATVALGWIADPRSRDDLVNNNELSPSPIYKATTWALGRIDGKEKKE